MTVEEIEFWLATALAIVVTSVLMVLVLMSGGVA